MKNLDQCRKLFNSEDNSALNPWSMNVVDYYYYFFFLVVCESRWNEYTNDFSNSHEFCGSKNNGLSSEIFGVKF